MRFRGASWQILFPPDDAKCSFPLISVSMLICTDGRVVSNHSPFGKNVNKCISQNVQILL